MSRARLPRGDATRTPCRVALVCLGNICRSPMAAVVLEDRLERAGLADDVEVVSAGHRRVARRWPMDERAAEVLTEHGYDATRHRASQFDAGWFETCDLILVMDGQNHRDVTAIGQAIGLDDRPGVQVRMFRDYDPAGTR